MKNIRKATTDDLSRIAEMIVFNYRLNFYPIFQDDGFVKGIIQIENQEIKKRLKFEEGTTEYLVRLER